jgi:DNA-binding MarR family transcriptional regulator
LPRALRRPEEPDSAGPRGEVVEDGEHEANGDRERGSPSAAELAETLLLTTQALKSVGRAGVEGCDPVLRAISLPGGRVLMAMDDAGEVRVRMGDLSAALGVTARNVTTIVDGLEHEGLLARRRDPTDRRAILLELTAKGREHIAGVHALHRAVAERFFAPLNGAECCELLRLLRKMLVGAGCTTNG